MPIYYCYNCNTFFTSKEDMGEIEVQGPSLLGNNPEKPCNFGLCKRCYKKKENKNGRKQKDHKI